MEFDEMRDVIENSYMKTFKRQQICFAGGEGAVVWDTKCNKYVDMMAGIAVNAVGYHHPVVTSALKEQLDRIVHTSNLFYIENQAILAKKLLEVLPKGLDKIFLANTGAEANEGALKLAVKHTGRTRIVSALESFHGRTCVALSVTGQRKYQKGYEPLLCKTVDFVKFGDVQELEKVVTSNTAAIILEPIQGESGVRVAPDGYLKKARRIADEKGALLIFDEVQCGMGRTGDMFACMHENVTPDIMTLAKSLGAGVPIGAIIASEKVAATFSPGEHGTTFGGNPLACAAAIAVLDVMKNEKLVENAKVLGGHLITSFLAMQTKYPGMIKEVRGRGLMIGVEMESDLAAGFQGYALANGFLINVANVTTVRLIPPLVLKRDQADKLLELFEKFLNENKKQAQLA